MVDPAEAFGAKADGFVARAPGGTASRLDHLDGSLDAVEALLGASSRTFMSLPEANPRLGPSGPDWRMVARAASSTPDGVRAAGAMFGTTDTTARPWFTAGRRSASPCWRTSEVQGRLLGDKGDSIPSQPAGATGRGGGRQATAHRTFDASCGPQ